MGHSPIFNLTHSRPFIDLLTALPLPPPISTPLHRPHVSMHRSRADYGEAEKLIAEQLTGLLLITTTKAAQLHNTSALPPSPHLSFLLLLCLCSVSC